jgi:aspartokinase/homoserine dehydrogenase 1
MRNQSQPHPPTLVMKFGGTSVGTPDAMARAAAIVQDSRRFWPDLVVVTSALSTVTNLLLEGANQAAAGDEKTFARNAADILKLHTVILEALIVDKESSNRLKTEIQRLVDEFTNRCQAILVLGEITPRALDYVAGLGERLSVRLLAAALEARGVAAQAIEATRLIVTDEAFQHAHPDMPATTVQTRQALAPVLAQGNVAVVTGFIAATRDGILTTLGRGGSDYTAGILGAALPADEVWIWTDVDGVLTADPRMAPNAQTIPEITYREIAELAYFGAKVLHPKTIRPVVDAGIRLRICNTFNPEHPGTRLVPDTQENNGRKPDGRKVVKAVTAIRGQRLITVEGRGMLGVPGVAARTFGAVASTGASVTLITQASSEQSICFSVPGESVDQVIDALEKAFTLEIADQDIDQIWSTGDVAIITVVGAGMLRTPGVSGEIFTALGDGNVNVIAIAQGSSEVSISMVVDAQEAEAAVKHLHTLILKSNHHNLKLEKLPHTEGASS